MGQEVKGRTHPSPKLEAITPAFFLFHYFFASAFLMSRSNAFKSSVRGFIPTTPPLPLPPLGGVPMPYRFFFSLPTCPRNDQMMQPAGPRLDNGPDGL